MAAFTPFDKMSKKQQKEQNARKRGSWNGVDCRTKVVVSKKVYDRNRIKDTERKAGR